MLTSVPSARLAREILDGENGGSYWRGVAVIEGAPARLFQQVMSEFDKGVVHPPKARVALFDNVTVRGCGVVTTADGNVVAESLTNTQFGNGLGTLRRTSEGCVEQAKPSPLFRRRLGGRPYVLLKQTWDANYGHWLIECLPRVALVAEHFDLSDLRFIVSAYHGDMQKIYIETLAAFGIRRRQIKTTGYRELQVDRLIYPLPMTEHPWVKAPRTIAILEKLGADLAIDAVGPKRIYVSRNGAAQRRLINEAEIIEKLLPLGFVVVRPEKMRFVDQVRAFKDAEFIIGNYGANLTNAVFAPRGLTLFALTTQNMGDNFFWDLTNQKQGAYLSLHGRAVGPNPNLHSDFEIDVGHFLRMVKAIPQINS